MPNHIETLGNLGGPGINVLAREFKRRILSAHVMDERAAAALAFRCNDLHAKAIEKRDLWQWTYLGGN